MALARKLPDAYREPLMLRALQGMRGRHIASILNLSEATVETRIARARRMLRELACDGEQEEGEPESARPMSASPIAVRSSSTVPD